MRVILADELDESVIKDVFSLNFLIVYGSVDVHLSMNLS